MDNLNIIDVSALIYCGSMSEYFSDKSNYGFSIGGIRYLMRQVITSIALGDYVVLCFDSPSFRKNLLDSYKVGRVHRPDIYSQIEFTYDSLMGCGFRCEKYDGYEADDIVNWAVQSLHNNYIETVIIGNDHDLCHNVQRGVRFKSIATNSSCVYTGNFEKSVDKTFTKFNTISAKKALCGCSSDKIPAIKLKYGVDSKELYSRFLDFFEEWKFPFTYETTSDPRYLLAFANSSELFDDSEKKELLKRIRLVYPAGCPKGVEIRPVGIKDFNGNRMAKFLSMIADYDSLRCLGLRKVELSEDDKQTLRDLGKRLSSGEYAADNNLEIDRTVPTKTLELSSFTKEF